ncbi:MAG: DUF3662 domain-containing protein [Anaerolineales bacterium]|nr:DUF3662 domain-containing protein [Anaerolineales bacterium]
MEPVTSELEATITRYLQQSLKSLPWLGIDVPDILRNLAAEVFDSTRTDSEGNQYAPDQFTLTTSPISTGQLKTDLGLIQSQISLQMEEALSSSGFRLTHPVHITFATDPTLSLGEVRVIAWHSRDPLQINVHIRDYEEPGTSSPPPGAFFIVGGKRHFPLTEKRIQIGRRLDNDLVLDDMHISRQHAELIATEGHYLLRDLNSTAGTRVNKTLIKERQLEPGDVIHLASVEIIYGEDPHGPPNETPPYKAVSRSGISDDHSTPLGLKALNDMDTNVLREDADEN